MEGQKNFFSVSIRGESHIRSGKPKQDFAIAIKANNLCLGVVCDGHGANKHFRSDVGSRIAAEITQEKLLQFSSLYPNWDSINQGNNLEKKLECLKLSIISEWQNRIETHEKELHFTEEELKNVSGSFSERRNFDDASPYGTTLLAALICNDYFILIMLGDGAIVKIKTDKSCELVKFKGKKVFDDQPHSATDSLCEPDCHQKMFMICEQHIKDCGMAYALCSDGLSEAFSTDKILFDKLRNYIDFFVEEGLEMATDAIEKQLQELSRVSAMKDDISLAFVTNDLMLFDKSQAEDQRTVSKVMTETESKEVRKDD